MSVKSVQFSVAAHILAALGIYPGGEVGSATLADSVRANPTFVRKSLSKLSKAGLVVTTRGKTGASVLARPPKGITLLDIYRASAARRRLPFIHIRWRRNARSVATSRNACQRFFLKLRKVLRNRWRK